jgi:hypothetical protein
MDSIDVLSSVGVRRRSQPASRRRLITRMSTGAVSNGNSALRRHRLPARLPAWPTVRQAAPRRLGDPLDGAAVQEQPLLRQVVTRGDPAQQVLGIPAHPQGEPTGTPISVTARWPSAEEA